MGYLPRVERLCGRTQGLFRIPLPLRVVKEETSLIALNRTNRFRRRDPENEFAGGGGNNCLACVRISAANAAGVANWPSLFRSAFVFEESSSSCRLNLLISKALTATMSFIVQAEPNRLFGAPRPNRYLQQLRNPNNHCQGNRRETGHSECVFHRCSVTERPSLLLPSAAYSCS